jgi:hypothetical protein
MVSQRSGDGSIGATRQARPSGAIALTTPAFPP